MEGEKLALIVTKCCFDENPKEKLKTITSKCNLPSKLKEIVSTKINYESCRVRFPQTREAGLKMQTIQKSLVVSLISMSLLSNKLLQLTHVIVRSNLTKSVNLASDSMVLINSDNRELNMKRRENIKPDLQLDYKLLCSTQVPTTSNLFEDNPQSDIVYIKNVSRLTLSLTLFIGPQPSLLQVVLSSIN